MKTLKTVAVFGATGAQGGSVLRALVNTDEYHIRAITRNANSEKAKQLASLKNVSIRQADLNDPASVEKAIDSCYGVFLVTDFWADPTARVETQQGINLIDSAIRQKVAHVVFSGLENAGAVVGKSVDHFDDKEKVEQHGMKAGDKIKFTSIRMPLYYQIIPTMFLKHVKPETYELILPMSDKPVYCMNVEDYGECVKVAFEKPDEYKSRIVGLAADYLTPNEIVAALNKNLQPNTFTNANLSCDTYGTFGFPGATELAHMFEYYQLGKMKRDINLTKQLNPGAMGFNNWVAKNKLNIIKNLPQN